MTVYEYPFNERIRTMLRLEDLYDKFRFFAQQDNPLQHHVALTTMFEMLEVCGRADLKSDLLQELERQKQTLASFKSNPNVEAERLNAIISDVEQTSSALISMQGKTGQHIRENEWLMSIRGRTIIPGGACEFDLPSYFAWQQLPTEQRRADIMNWFAPLEPMFAAIMIVLRLLRESGRTTDIVAPAGSFQQMLQGRTYQLLRVAVDSKLGAIPEISANKYVLWIRFTTQGGDLKPKAFESDVPFELTLCNF